MKTALVIVDVQNDFCPGGALATARGDEVASKIAELISTADSRTHEYDYFVATQDWHIDPGAHFSETPDFVDSWPPHCVADSYGAQVRGPVKTDLIDQFFKKGHFTAAYSGFEGVNGNDELLADWLRTQWWCLPPGCLRHRHRPLRARDCSGRTQRGLQGQGAAGHVFACRR